ncbi:MAG TPA: hypothetical protein VF092_31005 [Longimicrobium sp.]
MFTEFCADSPVHSVAHPVDLMPMSDVLSFPGAYWAVRIMATVFMAGATWLAVLVLARFFRPKHIKALVLADPPKLDEIRGEFGGVKGAIRFNAQGSALNALENRIDGVELSLERLWRITEEHSRGLTRMGMEVSDGHQP